jgi:predicted GNAT family N-acyltransferase
MTIGVIDTLTDQQVRELVGLLGTTDWAADRDREGVVAMLDGSDVVVGLEDDDRLVAFARALTDGEYRAFVYDVVVAEPRRGEGLGRRVVEELLAHPDLDVEAVDLYCQPELVEFYEQWGFSEDVGSLRLLRRSG